jgi:hypothetical protein
MPAGFLLAEDAAVKTRFSGLTVSDDRNNQRPVKVFFRYPENETEREYPFITIELIDIIHAKERQHSHTVLYQSTSNASADWYTANRPHALTYWPSEHTDFSTYASEGPFVKTAEFLAMDLVYQVSTFTRSALHDRQLISQIMRNRAQWRWGFIDIPEDGTTRRFTLLDWVTADLLDSESGYRKRIFRKVYTVQLNADLPVSSIEPLYQALGVSTSIKDLEDNTLDSVNVAPSN